MARTSSRSDPEWKRYVDEQGEVVEVSRGLADWWIVGRTKFHSAWCHRRKRVKSPAMPPRKSPAECQADLDAYAAKRGWKLYEGE